MDLLSVGGVNVAVGRALECIESPIGQHAIDDRLDSRQVLLSLFALGFGPLLLTHGLGFGADGIEPLGLQLLQRAFERVVVNPQGAHHAARGDDGHRVHGGELPIAAHPLGGPFTP